MSAVFAMEVSLPLLCCTKKLIFEGNEVNHEDGAFGETITAKGDVQIKIPDNLSFEEASTLGVGITT